MKFIMLNQNASITTYTGPSGSLYTLVANMPFEVENKQDIEFFKQNKDRFQKFKAKKQAPVKSNEELLADFLKEIKGVEEKTIKKVVDTFGSLKELKLSFSESGMIGSGASKKQEEIIVKKLKEVI